MDVNTKPSARKPDLYQNAIFAVETEKRRELTGKDEGYYEHLRFSDKPGDRKNSQQEDVINRIKSTTYVLFTMVIVLYIAVIVLVVIIAMPKDQDSVNGNWARWSPWSSCDVTCGNGSKTRLRTCLNSQQAGGYQCNGNATDIAVCRMASCLGKHASFSAKLVDTGPFLRPNQRIVFNEVLSNNMNGYDSSSGIFEAPLSGVYLFIYFIEIGGAYGKVELRLDDKIISHAVAYGMSVDFSISGIDNNVTFESTTFDEMKNTIYENFRCIGGKYSVSGIRNTVTIQPGIDEPTADSCPYTDGVVALGGNTVLVYIHAGERV